MVLYITIVAFFGFFIVQSGVYSNSFAVVSSEQLKVEPYVYAFVCYFFLFYPLKDLKIQRFSIDKLWSNQFKTFLYVWIVYFITYTILKANEALTSLSFGLANAYEERHNEGIILFTYDNFLIDKLNSYGPFFINATVPAVMLFSLIGVAKGKINKAYSLFLVALCFVPSILEAIGRGTRGGIFMTIFCLFFFIILLRTYLPQKYIKNIIIWITAVLIFSVLFSWLITTDRVGEGEEGIDSVLHYFGEPFPNLGFSFWNKVLVHPMGLRLFPDLFGFNQQLGSTADEYEFWRMITGVPVLTFKTFFGDLYIEFGTMIALIFTFTLSASFRFYYHKHGITFYNLSFLYFYFQLCVFSLAGFTKGGHHSTFQVIIIILFVMFLKFIIPNAKKSISHYSDL